MNEKGGGWEGREGRVWLVKVKEVTVFSSDTFWCLPGVNGCHGSVSAIKQAPQKQTKQIIVRFSRGIDGVQ